MKKIFILPIAFLVSALLFSSCEKDDIGGTNGEKTAGEWYVTVVAIDEGGNVVYDDDELFGIGHFHLDTYNTVANDANEMWIDDNTNFWEFKGKVSVDPNALTFSGTDVQNQYYDSKFSVSNGKILIGAATTPSGMPADSIVFDVAFDDDTNLPIGDAVSYRITGYRYTGFTGDE
jgi:hypothetical protein